MIFLDVEERLISIITASEKKHRFNCPVRALRYASDVKKMSSSYLLALIDERDILYEVYRVSLDTVKILREEIGVIKRRFEEIDSRLPDPLLREFMYQIRPLSVEIDNEYRRLHDTRTRIRELNMVIDRMIYRMGHVGPVGA